MPIGEILGSRRIDEVEENANISDIAKLMRDDDVGAVLITRGNKPVGVVTDRDIALRCSKGDVSFKDIKAKDIMSSPVVCVRPDDGIYKIIETMQKSECRRVVVLDNQDKILGLLSSGDLLKLLVQELTMLSKVLTPESDKISRSKVA